MTTTFPEKSTLFVDESKSNGYFLVATTSTTGGVRRTSQSIRSLVRRGQRRIHFKSESPASRRALLSRFGELQLTTHVYVVKGLQDAVARPRCLVRLIEDAADSGVVGLYLERDESVEARDRITIRETLQRVGYREQLTYEHVSPSDQPLLWVSDAVAWCHQAGGEWRRRADSLVSGVTQL